MYSTCTVKVTVTYMDTPGWGMATLSHEVRCRSQYVYTWTIRVLPCVRVTGILNGTVTKHGSTGHHLKLACTIGCVNHTLTYTSLYVI